MSILSTTPSISIPPTAMPRRFNRPPRIAINPIGTGPPIVTGLQSGMPFTAQTAAAAAFLNTAGPNWPQQNNPFNQMYAAQQTAPKGFEGFMVKGFEGFVDFTKSGMSFGEKFSYGLYNRISKWSKKWFTHLFLFFVVLLYSVGGALLFQAVEGTKAVQVSKDSHVLQKNLFEAMHLLSSERLMIRTNVSLWNSLFIGLLREHTEAVDTFLRNEKTLEELEAINNPWSFWNSMFYCGTIYTTIDAPAIQRRKRKVARQLRDKTPEPRSTSTTRKYSDEDSSNNTTTTSRIEHFFNSQTKVNTAANFNNPNDTNLKTNESIQTVRMQIRPPGTMSAHESKILRRRNHGFSGAAARSQSQPRPVDSNADADMPLSAPLPNQDYLRSALRRSLSSTRHQDPDEFIDLDESHESRSSESAAGNLTRKIISQYSPLPELHRKLASGNMHNVDEEKVLKLEMNLRRFDAERQKFEMDKKKFDREKRELHKIRYRQMLENEERKRMLLNYRKLSGERSMPSDSDDYLHQQRQQQQHRSTQSFREPQKRTNIGIGHSETRKPEIQSPKKTTEYESSTVSESDSDIAMNRRTLNRSLIETENASKRQRSANRRDNNFVYHDNAEIMPNRSLLKPRNPVTLYDNYTNHNQQSSQIRSSEDNFEDAISQNTQTPSLSPRNHHGMMTTMQAEQKPSRRNSSLSPPKRQRNKSTTPEPAEPENQHQEITETESHPQRPLTNTKLQEHHTEDSIFMKITAMFKRPHTVSQQLADEKKLDFRAYFSWNFVKSFSIELRKEWLQMIAEYPQAIQQIQYQRNKCFSHFIILALYIGFGGLIFRFTEGTFENIFKCEVRKVKRDFIDQLWLTSHNLREDDWKSSARMKLRKFEEELHVVHESGFRYAGMKSWNFLNSVIYCLTVVTAIGYGHIAPQTTLGRSITIVYAIIGIPIFLILLADFGKLFTRCMKFVWAYIRRLYYTGTCRKVRKNQQMQDMMKGINTVYDVAIRRPSQFIRDIDVENASKSKTDEPDTPLSNATAHLSHAGTNPDTPNSPYPETFEVDDEFNLPVSVASTILILYIITGAMIYASWEKWTYFESFYFVFISMSTIGFGDFVPNHPIFMMCSIVYLVFGLALTSMFINVVQIKLSDSFNQASAKISATIGLTLAEEELSRNSQLATPINEVPVVPVNGSDTPASGEYEGVNAAILLKKNTEANASQKPLPPSAASTAEPSLQHSQSLPPPPPLLPRTSASAAAVQHLMEEENAKKNKKKSYFK